MGHRRLKNLRCSQVFLIEWAKLHLRMTRGGAASPALPVELWGQVASFLTLRESCMLASTCRALWAMDLLSVTVLQGGKSECDLLNEGSCPAPGDDTALHCYCSERLVMHVFDA